MKRKDQIVGFDGDAQKFLGKKYKKDDFIKTSDIVEVWFDSGATHSYVLEKKKRSNVASLNVPRRL